MWEDIGAGEGPPGESGARVLIYSHDTMGLGHLRRCRAIAHALVERYKHLSVLILSGSPIIGSFDFRARVDFVRIPGVIKLRNGEYTALNLHIDLEKTLSMRSSIIRHTANIFDPHVFIVDKEPLGLRGEVEETLVMLKERGTHLVLGLRDVMDSPSLLAPEWERKNVMPALRRLYDAIWIYGLPQICNPLEDITVPKSVSRKITYTGYLRRAVPNSINSSPAPAITRNPYILVTTGGGGDGEDLIEWVLRAYETDPLLPYPALLILGPFMQPELQAEFRARVSKLKRVDTITFDTRIENLEANAVGIVAMGGYNTFCEILSMDKRAIIVPRTAPRMEQYIRASRAQELGLVQMIEDDDLEPAILAAALRRLGRQKKPSDTIVPGLLEGLDNVNRLIEPWLETKLPAAEEGAVRRPA
jgi:predicted glycosyltransferase